MDTTITYTFKTTVNIKEIGFNACKITFITRSYANKFHKLVCTSNIFRNCFSSIEENEVTFTFDVNSVKVEKHINSFAIIIED